MPMSSAMITAMAASSALIGTRLVISFATGVRLTRLRPRSPCTTPAIQRRYCSWTGTSRPSSRVSCSRRAGSTTPPSVICDMITSPGTMRIARNTNSVTPQKTGTMRTARRMRYARIGGQRATLIVTSPGCPWVLHRPCVFSLRAFARETVLVDDLGLLELLDLLRGEAEQPAEHGGVVFSDLGRRCVVMADAPREAGGHPLDLEGRSARGVRRRDDVATRAKVRIVEDIFGVLDRARAYPLALQQAHQVGRTMAGGPLADVPVEVRRCREPRVPRRERRARGPLRSTHGSLQAVPLRVGLARDIAPGIIAFAAIAAVRRPACGPMAVQVLALAAEHGVQVVRTERVAQAFEHHELHELPRAGALAVGQGRDDPKQRLGGTDEVRGRLFDALIEGRALVPPHPVHARVGLQRRAVCAPRAERSTAPPAVDADGDDVGLDRLQIVVGKPELGHDAGAEVVDHDIALRRELERELLPAGAARVERDAFLAAVQSRIRRLALLQPGVAGLHLDSLHPNDRHRLARRRTGA